MNNTLWHLTKSQCRRYASAILAMLVATACIFSIPLIIKYAIDHIVASDSTDLALFSQYQNQPTLLLAMAALVCVLLTALSGIFLYLRDRWASGAAERIVRSLRDRLYNHLERLPCAFHDRVDTGDMVQRCTSDVETLRSFLDSQVVEIGRTIVLVLLATPLLFWLNTELALVSIVLLPVILIFAVVFFRKVQTQFLLTDQAEAWMTTVLQENLTGIRAVRAFARQPFESEKFAAANAQYRDDNQKLIILLGYYWASADFLGYGQIGLTLLYGAALLSTDELSVGTLFAFLTYLGLIIWPLRQMGRVLTEAGKAMVALKRLQEILQQTAEPEPGSVTAKHRQTLELSGAIEFDQVSFDYAGEPVLCDLSFRLAAGETLALIGPPGAGKTTIVQLLLRLYDYQQGSIRLDGHELTTLDRETVRSQISVVLQEPFLYSKTLAANLRIGDHGASQQRLEKYAATACVHESIGDFSDAYDTMVGERGVTLSGGQRQRVALARALLKEPAILILDDALSAVDTRTEAHILTALQTLRRKRKYSTIIIAHRLSSVTHADTILVLEQGRIVQSGSHQQLLEQPGAYQRLWQIQNALEDEIRTDCQVDKID